MEGESPFLTGARGRARNKGGNAREERKRRRLCQQKHDDASSLFRVCNDDRSCSPASAMEVSDRLTFLEQRMQMQEEEIQMLKMALSDVLKRLSISEEHQAAAGRRAASRPASLALPCRPSMGNPSGASLKKGTALPSSATGKNYTPPSLNKSAMRSPAGSVCSSKTTRTPSRPTSAASSCSKMSHDSKAKEPSVCAGTRRVTHCKDISEPPIKKDWIF